MKHGVQLQLLRRRGLCGPPDRRYLEITGEISRGEAWSTLPLASDVDLLGYCERTQSALAGEQVAPPRSR